MLLEAFKRKLNALLGNWDFPIDTSSTIAVDTITEHTADNGLDIDSVTIKDGLVTGNIKTDSIVEKTGANGVTIDGLNIKDGNLTLEFVDFSSSITFGAESGNYTTHTLYYAKSFRLGKFTCDIVMHRGETSAAAAYVTFTPSRAVKEGSTVNYSLFTGSGRVYIESTWDGYSAVPMYRSSSDEFFIYRGGGGTFAAGERADIFIHVLYEAA